jgi:hypothetical protein
VSNYTKATNFATKDTLPSGNAGKVVKGTEIDTEFNAISSAIASKADTASPTFTGTPAVPTATSGSNTTQIANTAYVTAALADIGSSIVQVVKATTTSSSVSTSFPTLQATSHSATITPTSSTSKILVIVSSSAYTFGTGAIGVYSVFRGSTNLCGNGTNKFTIESGIGGGTNQFQGSVHMTFLDEPASTSALTYTVYQGCANGGSSEYNISLFATMLLVEIK